jgi:hypothetical protein
MSPLDGRQTVVRAPSISHPTKKEPWHQLDSRGGVTKKHLSPVKVHIQSPSHITRATPIHILLCNCKPILLDLSLGTRCTWQCLPSCSVPRPPRRETSSVGRLGCAAAIDSSRISQGSSAPLPSSCHEAELRLRQSTARSTAPEISEAHDSPQSRRCQFETGCIPKKPAKQERPLLGMNSLNRGHKTNIQAEGAAVHVSTLIIFTTSVYYEICNSNSIWSIPIPLRTSVLQNMMLSLPEKKKYLLFTRT